MTDDESKTLHRRVTEAVARLMEHFDVVQIMACKHEPSSGNCETYTFTDGNGNWHARYGMTRTWLLRTEAGFTDPG